MSDNELLRASCDRELISRSSSANRETAGQSYSTGGTLSIGAQGLPPELRNLPLVETRPPLGPSSVAVLGAAAGQLAIALSIGAPLPMGALDGVSALLGNAEHPGQRTALIGGFLVGLCAGVSTLVRHHNAEAQSALAEAVAQRDQHRDELFELRRTSPTSNRRT